MNHNKYQNQYRVDSARWAGWDYGSNAAYFITICPQNKKHSFGEVVNGKVNLTMLGHLTWECWFAIPEHFPFVRLDEFMVMPNHVHVHGVVIISKTMEEVKRGRMVDKCDNRSRIVETQNFASLRPHHSVNKFGPQSQNSASIVRGFKIGVTKYARQCHLPFAWQPRYHDHVIRNAVEHERIRQYIIENPQNWEMDSLYG